MHRIIKIAGTSTMIGIGFAALAVALTACGEQQDVVMPDVQTKRLDIALSDIERAGFGDDVDVLGGGLFGVVDESNWTVCSQEPAPGHMVSSAPRLTVDRSCDTGDGPSADTDETSPDASAGGGTEHRAAGNRANKQQNNGHRARDTFVMPPLVGMNLQDAQDTLQAHGSYLLDQTDATGMGRFQLLDSDWKVCYQKPAAGTEVPLMSMVQLGAVKLNESCA